MPTSDYELWDTKSANLVFFSNDKDDFVGLLQLLFDENRLAPALDDLAIMVYHADSQTEIIEGVEEIEQWLTENE